MPNNYVNKLAREGKGSVAELEKKWDAAKQAAADADHAEDWPYVTSIFQSMVGASVTRAFAKVKLEGHGHVVHHVAGARARCGVFKFCSSCVDEVRVLAAAGVDFSGDERCAALISPSDTENTAMEEIHDPDPVENVVTPAVEADEAGPFQGVATTAAARLLATRRID